ncbi:MAG: tryptophan synthase subunit alpha, partial [Candidatus Peribacteraceae bacterium]|nr:tryptophan synthase subunit alpha [Candidatus Peribacteraceae bacterium]
IVRTLVESGADALELSFPFSDPPADGPVIQAADLRALQSGIRIDDCFEMLREIRTFTSIPIGLLVYYNLILQRGIEKFYQDCAASGVNSVLIADLPLEHADEILPIIKKHGIAPVCLVSELTSDERMKKIAAIAGGYLYVVSYIGVTGASDGVLEEKMRGTIERARKCTDLPLIVGFGINTQQQIASAVRAGANGVIVGSRIVKEIPNLSGIRGVCKELSTPIFQ